MQITRSRQPFGVNLRSWLAAGRGLSANKEKKRCSKALEENHQLENR
jgi:hypothetical protein